MWKYLVAAMVMDSTSWLPWDMTVSGLNPTVMTCSWRAENINVGGLLYVLSTVAISHTELDGFPPGSNAGSDNIHTTPGLGQICEQEGETYGGTFTTWRRSLGKDKVSIAVSGSFELVSQNMTSLGAGG